MGSILTAEGDAAMRAYYEQRAGEYDEWYLGEGRFAGRADAARWHHEVALLRERVGLFGSGRLLEVAAGTGWWTELLARRASVTVLDYAPAMLAQVRARLRARGLRADLVRADAYALPLAPASFDCCFFGFWLSHVPYGRLPGFLDEIRRVVRPGGHVMVVDSAWSESGHDPGVEFFHERILNDGSRHMVLKIVHTARTTTAALAPLGGVIDAWETGKFFTGAVAEVR